MSEPKITKRIIQGDLFLEELFMNCKTEEDYIKLYSQFFNEFYATICSAIRFLEPYSLFQVKEHICNILEYMKQDIINFKP